MSRIFITALILFGAIALYAQRIPKPKPVIVKATSTECNVCGLKAWDTFKDIIDLYERDAVIMAAHPLELSSLFSNTALEYVDKTSQFYGTPTLLLNNESASIYWIQDVKDYIKNFQKRQIVVHPFINYQIEGQQLSASIKTQFFKDVHRPYYLAVYVIEDAVTANQASRGLEDKHSKVLRTHLGENALGTLLSSDEIKAEQVFQHEFTLELDSTWNADKIEVAAIILEKVGEQYRIINSNIAFTAELSTSINQLAAAGVQLSVQPNIITNRATITLDLPKAYENIHLELFNTLGQEVASIFTGDLLAGQHNFEFNRKKLTSSGIHFLRIENQGHQLIKKIILK